MPNYLEADFPLSKHRGIYLFSKEQNTINTFSNFFDKIDRSHSKLQKLSLTLKAIYSETINETGFVAIYINHEKVYCGVIGKSKITIERNGNSYELFSKKTGVRMGSGKFISGDFIRIDFPAGQINLKYKKLSTIRYFLLFLVNILIAFFKVLFGFFRHKSLPIFGFLILICLFISMFIGTYKRKQIDGENLRAISIKQVDEDINKIRALYTTNTKASWDYYQSRRSDLMADPQLKEKIDSVSSELFRIENVDPSKYFDFGLIDQNFKISKFSGASGLMVFVSNSLGKIVTLDPKDKHTDISSFEGYEIKSVTSYLDNFYYQANNSVFDNDKNILLSSIQGNLSIKAYGGNLYVLDQDKYLIYRSTGESGRFNSPVKWFSESVTTPEAIGGWSIDGAIWVISKNGIVFRYTGGTIASYYSLTNAFFEEIEVEGFYTDETLENLYVLYKGGEEIGVYSKEGKFLKEYRLGNGIKFSDIYVSGQNLKLIGISETQLYSIDLVDPV